MYAQQQHIPQPPHSAGEPYKGLRARIDPSQIPSPIEAIEADKDQWEGHTYMTLPGHNPPLSTTDCVCIDQGNSSPKHIRVSTWNLPSSSHLARECEIPLAAVFQPFADLDPREEAVPLVECGEAGPARCAECRGYINPWCEWTAGGSKWKCNLCAHETEVSPDYFCNLDTNLMRLDHLQRPELNKGTVDFVVSAEEYWAPPPLPKMSTSYFSIDPPLSGPRKPQSMRYVLAFDVSIEAVQSGFLQSACACMRDLLYGGTTAEGASFEPCFPRDCEIAILTFDRTLHFYNLSPSLPQASMMVLSDLDEVFLPLREGLFAYPEESRAVIESLLDVIPHRHGETVVREAGLGSALLAGLASLAGRGGHMVVFQSTLPSVGPGALEPLTDQTSVYGTEKERDLFLPRNQTWRDIAEECAEEGIGVSMFLGMSKAIDIGSIGIVSSTTGGELYFHPRFNPARDTIVLASQLRRLVTRTTAYNCLMRIRCSNGLRVSKHYGSFHERTATDLEIGVLDSDKAISVLLEHSRSLDERQYAHLQCAVLYTSTSGQRRVRTCNLALQVATLAGSIFRYADMDTVVCHLARDSMAKLTSRRMAHIREDLTEKCSSLLLGYRRNCAASTSPSQLIIPEAFRALPVYTLAISKSKSLKGRNVSADVRNYHAQKILSMSVRSTMQHLYPRLLAIHDLDENIALPDPATGQLALPSLMRNSHMYMEAHGVYLIGQSWSSAYNEDCMIFWVGSSVSPQLLRDLFAVDDFLSLDPHIVELPNLPTRISAQVRNILAHRYAQRGRVPKMLVARQNTDGMELEFSDMLIEDQNNAAMSYLDYLCLVHKQINVALTSGGSISGGPSLRGSPW
ncbi:beta-sandwich domain of Sec23/24 [Leucogyrophana mollusca]|uniref:Beta-sandwich domain of Sec23/24 n=1 Tax=Leucogyrophana mollusca TaxID=85980 RepID=A0ACB8BK97_9AGAM|nr:beta-sandwich domain of Sec23/24 [Leucogyrophana mollusca]